MNKIKQNTQMKTVEEILKEYVDFEDVNGNETVELLPLTIVDAMEEYAQQSNTRQEWVSVDKLRELISRFKKEELGEISPYSPEAEIEAGFNRFLKWVESLPHKPQKEGGEG